MKFVVKKNVFNSIPPIQEQILLVLHNLNMSYYVKYSVSFDFEA
jgi:hypothetical protein